MLGLREIGRGGMDWIGLAQVEGSCEYGKEPSCSLKYRETIEWLHNWWSIK
jgi:hypothetical protein